HLAAPRDRELAVNDRDDRATGGAMLRQHGRRRIAAEEHHSAATQLGHLDDELVVGIQDRSAAARNCPNWYGLDAREIADFVDAVQPEVVALADVGDDGDVAQVEAQAFAQDAAACGLEHRSVDARVSQHGARALGAAAIAGVDAAILDVDAIGAGHAD